jgi:hypothetical protein
MKYGGTDLTDFPRSRTNDIVVQETADDLLVYDLLTHRALCLNPIAAKIWRLCDGTNSIPMIEKLTYLSTGLVHLALADLQKAGLIENNFRTSVLSRRKAIARIGSTLAPLPLVTTLLAPTSVHAQSSTCITGGNSFDLTSTPFFATAIVCVNALTAVAVNTCCSGSLNPAGGFQFSTSPQLCRGFCS